MRYRKGQISISEDRDIPLLLVARDARALRLSQFYAELLLKGLERSRQCAYWRLSRLVESGLIRKLETLRFVGEPVYTITRNGLSLLEEHGHGLVALGSHSRTLIHEADAMHMMELNALRLALLRSGCLIAWKGELQIISENLTFFGEGAKDYDAVVTVKLGKGKARFALEYERTAKSSARYREVRKAIELDHRVDHILYLTPSQELMHLLSKEFRGMEKLISFGIANQFKESLLDAQVFVNDLNPTRCSFQDLLRSHPYRADALQEQT